MLSLSPSIWIRVALSGCVIVLILARVLRGSIDLTSEGVCPTLGETTLGGITLGGNTLRVVYVFIQVLLMLRVLGRGTTCLSIVGAPIIITPRVIVRPHY